MSKLLNNLLVGACRSYQTLFPGDHPGEQRLGELHDRGETEQFYREYFEHELEKGAQSLARFERFSEGWGACKVLDFGCGGGGITCHLGTRFCEAWGIDIQAEKLTFAGRQAARLGRDNVRFMHYGGGQAPFDDASFDCLYSVDVLEHLPTPEFFVSEFARLLRPGGLLLLSFGPPWRHAHGKHMWSKLPGWWTHLLFPRSVVMQVTGRPPETTWEDLGLHRLTVSKFERIMRGGSFETLQLEYGINRLARPLRAAPVLREFLIAEVLGVFRRAG